MTYIIGDLTDYWQNVINGNNDNDNNNASQNLLSGLASSNEGYIPDLKNFDILNG